MVTLSKEINITILLLSFTIICVVVSGREASTSTIYDALESHGLPIGLLPKGVTNYVLRDDGSFEVYLEQACNAKFESELHYDRNVSGVLSFGQIRNLTGISAQDLFLWFPVKGIRVDIPSSGVIYFDVGVVYKQFSLSMFESPPDCVAAAHPPEINNHPRPFASARNLAKKLDGILRHRFDDGKNAREVM